jgi:hypothetical protein
VSIVPATLISSALYVEINISRKGRGTVYNLLKSRNYSNKVTTQTSNVEDKLNNLRMRAKVRTKIDRNLISLLSNPKLLELAYNNIKSKPGNMTPGVNPETLDGISGEWFTETAQLMKSGNFDFQPLVHLFLILFQHFAVHLANEKVIIKTRTSQEGQRPRTRC